MPEVINCIREDIWRHLPLNMTIAELGVWTGAYSEYILATAQPKMLYLVDIWTQECVPDYEGANALGSYENVLNGFHLYPNIIIWRGDTLEFLRQMKQGHLDAVYIDSSHTYEQTKAELNLAKEKGVKYILGHDYMPGCMGRVFGVIQAVDEFAAENGLKIQITKEDPRQLPPSYLLRMPCADL